VHIYGRPDASTKDLGQTQKVLFEAIKKDPELRQLISECKTYDPNIGYTGNNPTGGFSPTGQDAKAMTFYTASREDSILLQKKLDAVLARHPELKLDKEFNAGNVDTIIGQSKRVGICRDTFAAHSTAKGELSVRVDDVVRDRALNDPNLRSYKNGNRLTPEGLRELEKKVGLQDRILNYDDKGNLTMRVDGSSGADGKGSMYVTESGAESVKRDGLKANGEKSKGYTNRHALYQLYKGYYVEPVLYKGFGQSK
jgi:hypothetical protein